MTQRRATHTHTHTQYSNTLDFPLQQPTVLTCAFILFQLVIKTFEVQLVKTVNFTVSSSEVVRHHTNTVFRHAQIILKQDIKASVRFEFIRNYWKWFLFIQIGINRWVSHPHFRVSRFVKSESNVLHACRLSTQYSIYAVLFSSVDFFPTSISIEFTIAFRDFPRHSNVCNAALRYFTSIPLHHLGVGSFNMNCVVWRPYTFSIPKHKLEQVSCAYADGLLAS